MDAFIVRIRSYLDERAPQLRTLFDTMATEAKFAYSWLSEDLARLPGNAAVLEVGAGVFLLSCQLAADGFAVTAIEPTGVGFEDFEQLGNIVLELSSERPSIEHCKAENYTADARFDYAFSLNVMEHIDSPDGAIARVSDALKPGAVHRFLCPNYIFPYEPHFNIPTFLTKNLSRRVMRRRIETGGGIADPHGLWRSLNWITVLQVRRFVASDSTLELRFQRTTLVWMLERALNDQEFANRRSGWMIAVIRPMVRFRLHRLVGCIPVVLQPIMDVQMTKK
ncbi:hypothetical protein MycrhN_0307 [Mycolicibacterium rhodesiae NBB3]|uniref:Methyltransferase family protein n=1 Tax=Mycolicibacterium rhodesiae (strain NBB3) TaxID=710685 RepID=G8RIW2_MYCRN|nr:methyltransferase domain-containing protein [Mycolicibacterium rhodesiae]AEV70950.1 hypothetical protein MycrhN_0307 [Mycolicibacterium rhodesiae NBB3]